MIEKDKGSNYRSEKPKRQERQEFFDLIREFQESSEANNPDEVMSEVLEAQQAVRGEKPEN
jgi:hypothetical protein